MASISLSNDDFLQAVRAKSLVSVEALYDQYAEVSWHSQLIDNFSRYIEKKEVSERLMQVLNNLCHEKIRLPQE